MKVFISYSVDDRETVQAIASAVRPLAEPFFWDQNKEPGEPCWETIFKWIQGADCVIAVLTDKVVARGESVHNEIGFVKGKGKTVIPMVSAAVEKSRLGCLNGITYVQLDPGNLAAAIEQIKQKLVAMKLKREQDAWTFLAIAALAVVAILTGQKPPIAP